MKVGLGVRVDAEIMVAQFAVEVGGGEIHCLLGCFEIVLDKPNVFLGGTLCAGSRSFGHDVLTASEDGHNDEEVVFTYMAMLKCMDSAWKVQQLAGISSYGSAL